MAPFVAELGPEVLAPERLFECLKFGIGNEELAQLK